MREWQVGHYRKGIYENAWYVPRCIVVYQTPNTGFIPVCLCRCTYDREAIVNFAAGSDFENITYALGVMALEYLGSLKWRLRLEFNLKYSLN
jgi:hypothetical protein